MERPTARPPWLATALVGPTRIPACSGASVIAELRPSVDPVPILARVAGRRHGGDEQLHRFLLELADALAGQAEVLSHLAQSHRHVGLEPEPHANDGGLALAEPVEPVEDPLEIVRLDQE